MKGWHLLGRLLFGGFFAYNGINHFKHQQYLAQYAGAKGIPLPDHAVKLSGALLAFGGLSLMFGFKPKWGAAAIATFLAAASPSMHDFWNSDEQGRQNEMIHFSKNIALLGSALALLGAEE